MMRHNQPLHQLSKFFRQPLKASLAATSLNVPVMLKATFVKTIRQRAAYLLFLGISIFFLLSVGACTDEVTVDSSFEAPQPVVDAWLTDQPGVQTILLTQTQDYFVTTRPTGIVGANVQVCRGQVEPVCLTFVDQGEGRYTYEVGFGESLAQVGDVLTLRAELPDGTVAVSSTTVNRTARIDSLAFTFEEEQLGLDSGTYAQLYAFDLPGPGDRYLVRTTVNDTFYNRIEELTLVYDASFDGGTTTDGIAFIFPLRFAVNKRDTSGNLEPLNRGDSLYIEVWSLSAAAFEFLQEAQTQILNGDSQLFSLPVVNVQGNVIDERTGKPVLGMFNVSAVAAVGRKF